MQEIEKNLKKTKVVAIDELDFVNSKDQSVLYNIFDWPHFKKVSRKSELF